MSTNCVMKRCTWLKYVGPMCSYTGWRCYFKGNQMTGPKWLKKKSCREPNGKFYTLSAHVCFRTQERIKCFLSTFLFLEDLQQTTQYSWGYDVLSFLYVGLLKRVDPNRKVSWDALYYYKYMLWPRIVSFKKFIFYNPT